MSAQTASPAISTWGEVRRLLRPWRGQIFLIALGVLIFEGLSIIPPFCCSALWMSILYLA